MMYLNSEALEETRWWVNNLVAWNGRALLYQSTDHTIETDASLQGWEGIAKASPRGDGGYFHPKRVEFQLPELTKNVKPGENLRWCFHASFPDNKLLCVCDCLENTKIVQFLGEQIKDSSKPNKLLLSFINPHNPVSSSTVARWLKELLQMAGIDTSTFKSHSIRGAVTTEVARQGFPVSDILQFADWSQQNTLIKIYYRPKFNAAPGLAVFSGDSYIG